MEGGVLVGILGSNWSNLLLNSEESEGFHLMHVLGGFLRDGI